MMQSFLNSKWIPRLTPVFLFIGTLALFWKTGKFSFLDLDDPRLVPYNIEVLRGWNKESIAWAFATAHAGYQHPLTWLTFLLDVQLFGPDAGPIHLVSAAIHALNVVLLFTLLRYCTGSFGLSLIVALIFAVHPQRAESVAWVAERKDVLWGAFGFICLHCYARYRKGLGFGWYVGALLSLMAALLAKPMAVVLPPILLLFDIWPLGILKLDSGWKKFTRDCLLCIADKIPFFVLSCGWSALTVGVLRDNGALAGLSVITWDSRIAISATAYLGYLRNFFYPIDLVGMYPLEYTNLNSETVAGWGLVLLLSYLALLALRSGRPWLFVGWFWFFWVLLPVSGLLQNGPQAMADRYAYFATIGLSICMVWGVWEFLKLRSQAVQKTVVSMVAALIVLLGVKTYADLEYWRDSSIFWQRVLKVTADKYHCFFAHANYAGILLDTGKTEEAIVHAKASWLANPRPSASMAALAEAYFAQGYPERAERISQFLLRRDPRDDVGNAWRSRLLVQKGENREAALASLTSIQTAPSGGSALVVSDYYDGIDDLPNAIKYAAWGAQLTPWSLDYQRALWQLLRKQNSSLQETLAQLLKYTPAIGVDTTPFVAAAQEELNRGEFANAIILLTEAVKRRASERSLAMLAFAQFKSGDLAGSDSTLERLGFDEGQRLQWDLERCAEVALSEGSALTKENAALVLKVLWPIAERQQFQSAAVLLMIARSYSAMGEKEKALANLEKARALAVGNKQSGLAQMIEANRPLIQEGISK